MTIRVLIADDHRMFREGLRALLARQRDMVVVDEVSDGRAAVESAARVSPDVVLMDLALPLLNGVDATAAIRALTPAPRVLALSFRDDLRWVKRAFQAGAGGYVVKTAAFAELGQAIREVARGARFVSEHLVQRFGLQGGTPAEGGAPGASDEASEEPAPRPAPDDPESLFDTLTPREREVLHLVVEGLTSREVGAALAISPRTVDVHRKHIMDKLRVTSVAALVRLAIRGGLVVA